MRAARLHGFGEPLRVEDVPPDHPAEGEVAVRLTHASVNPLDLRLCRGAAGRPQLPCTPGCDGVGYTDTGLVALQGAHIGTLRSGTFAQWVVAPAAAVVQVPTGLDPRVAAALGIAGVTASHIVRRVARCAATDRVLVLGATGAVAMLAVQVAATTGATVWAHTRRSVAAVDALGAAHVVVADAATLRDGVREFRPTVIVDGLGGAFTAAAIRSVSTGARLVIYGVAASNRAEIDLATIYRRGVTIVGVATRELPPELTSASLADCLELAAAGRLRPVIADELPLAEVNTALDRLAARGVTGKLLLATG